MTLAIIIFVGIIMLGFILRLVEGIIKFALILILIMILAISAVFTHQIPTAPVTGQSSQ
jgi:hypothetical protein